MIGKKDEKRAAENWTRSANADAYRKAGHTRLAYAVKLPGLSWNGGPLDDISAEIEAIESVGWQLDGIASHPAGRVPWVLLTFKAA
jgi:hypothetical protein